MAIRDKDDPWNSIASGALTGGTLAIRQGPAAATMGAVFGGFILAMIEGVQIAMMRANHEAAPPVSTTCVSLLDTGNEFLPAVLSY